MTSQPAIETTQTRDLRLLAQMDCAGRLVYLREEIEWNDQGQVVVSRRLHSTRSPGAQPAAET